MSERGDIRALLVDDHPVVRSGLRMLLSGSGGVQVVAEASSGAEAVAAAARTAPDVVLLDLDLGGDDGLRYVPQVQAVAPAARVLVLTGSRDRGWHEAALVAGARGLVPKGAEPAVLLAAIRRVHAGELWFERGLVDVVLRRALAREQEPVPEPEAAKIASLTEREREIVELIGEGLRNEEIGSRLSISEKTVRNHLSAVFAKLGVADRLELVVYAFHHRVVRPRR